MWPYIQCFEQDIRASFKLFTRREDDSISKASFTAMTRDHHDELTAIDHSMICSDAIVIWINFKNYASLVIFFQPFLFCSVLFLNENYTYYTVFEFNYLFLVFLLLEAGSLVPKIHLQLEKKG